MMVFIPSRNRLDFTACKFFPESIVFVNPDAAEQYKKVHSDKHLIVIPEENRGFGFVNNIMAKYALDHGEKFYLFVDDDIFGMKKRVDGKPSKVFDWQQFLREGEQILRKHNLAQLGVSFSGHNWYVKDSLKFDTAVWCVLFNDAEKVREVGWYDEELFLFNDYEITARFILNGFKVANWYDYLVEHKMANKEGGAMDYYRKSDFMKQQAFLILRKYREHCRYIAKGSHGFPEIRMDWKSLRAESNRRKNYGKKT